MADIRIHRRDIERMATQQRQVIDATQETAGWVVDEAKGLARREAYDSGAYHDSIHTEPDRGVAPNGKVYAVAGGAVGPRFAPRAGVMRGPEVVWARFVEHGPPYPRLIMRRAAARAAKRRRR